jgi:putative thioredoxin
MGPAFESQHAGDLHLATAGLTVDEQQAVERFRKDILEPSMTRLVVVDFWAEWCGPCKALAPTLEKVCAEYADKGVVLAKLNVDEEPFIAAQFQVRSIPTVYAMFQGRPVADLTPARSESQLRQALDELLKQLPVQSGDAEAQADIAQFVALGEQALADGDGARAAGVFGQVIEMAPDTVAAHAGLIRALIAAGQVEEAQAALAAVPEGLVADPAIAAANSALELAAARPDDSELQALRALAAEAPADQQKQFDFAQAAFAAGSRDEAADTLLEMIRVEPEWNEGAAKAKLLQIFEAVGLEDPWVAATRRRLSLLLFG